MDKTKIDWCDSTWNPVTGCLHGCEYCYARGIAKRFSYEEQRLMLHRIAKKMDYGFSKERSREPCSSLSCGYN